MALNTPQSAQFLESGVYRYRFANPLPESSRRTVVNGVSSRDGFLNPIHTESSGPHLGWNTSNTGQLIYPLERKTQKRINYLSRL